MSDKLNKMSDKMWTQTTTNDKLDIQEDSIVQSVIDQYFQRSQAGIKKYNTTLDRNDLSLHEWLEHLKQELMDATLYIQKLQKEIVDSGKEKNTQDIHSRTAE